MKDDYLRRAIVVRVVDGDTIDVDVDLGFKITTHQRLRLARIDAPEVRGKERPEGLKAKNFVESMLNMNGDGLIYIQTFKSGKYGRYIAEVWFRDAGKWHNLSDTMMDAGMAEPYK